MKKLLLLAFLLVACGTTLSAKSVRDLAAGQVVAGAGYHDSPDGGTEQLRFQVLFCNQRNVLVEAHENYSDAGIPCR